MMILGLLLGLAAVIGLIEVSILALQRATIGQLVWVGPRMAWMAPLGYGLLAMPPALVLAVAARLWPARGRTFLCLGVLGLSLIGTYSVVQLLSQQRLHPAAVVLVALGIGFQAARATWRRPDIPGRLGRRFISAVVAIVLLLGALVEGRRSLREWRGERTASATRLAAGTPNVLLIILDTVRAIELGLYGGVHPTSPALDSLAARAVVFENAFATSSWTLPSHASMFTGRFPHELEADWRWPLERSWPTVAEVLQQRGFHTAGFVGNLYYTSEETGLARGFARYEDYSVGLKELLLSTEFVQLTSRSHRRIILREHAVKRAEVITADFLRWQASLDGRPFFAFLNLFDAHVPRYAPDSIRRRFEGATGQGDRDRYLAAIAYLDQTIAGLLRDLEQRGVLERTVVVISSDHGEQFGGHGLYDHGNSLYSAVIRVPLLVLLPGAAGRGMRVPQPVSLRNLGRTILELTGQGDTATIPGVSLARFWESGASAPELQDVPVLSELTPSPRAPANHRNSRGEIRSLVRDRWHYILNSDGTTELFDYRSDAREERDLAGIPRGSANALSSMRRNLEMLDRVYPRTRASGN
jgi:arylsulfatase A-like enzyme